MIVRALTIRQPWASAIACGLKRYETRPRRLSYRGPLAIHAGLTFGGDQAQLAARLEAEHALPAELPRGGIVALARMVDCAEITRELAEKVRRDHPIECALGFWVPGRFAYKLADVRPLRFGLEARGKQGLWTLTDAQRRDVLELAEAPS